MSTHIEPAVFHPHAASMDLPGIRNVSLDQPLRWLRAGAQDLARAWPLSLFYGVVFALLGYGLVHAAGDRPHLAMALISGFLFVAPVLATVFYCVSHRLEHHHKLPHLFVPLLSWRANPASLGLFALMLVFVLISWERISAILVGLFLGDSGIGSLPDLLSFGAIQQHTDFVLTYLVFGGALALMVFSLSVVSLPMLLHRKVDFATALVTSFMATRLNFPAMLLWGALIAVLILIGMATDFIAMAVIFPWLGHASWHAYRELIERG
ncbi:MAG: hypothetical protein B7X93_03175 [Hydrogenophilales bacterium 17-61-9]|nr:MAG: hypothetical protein B7Y33_03235 [Hydrogenophilales bacterium 16-62-9]OZA30458.1 MAG: hypothetical protein B7X93_03175 [Hydrogenophilales bacterium 17-61-9]